MSMSNQKVGVEPTVYTNIESKKNNLWQHVRLTNDV